MRTNDTSHIKGKRVGCKVTSVNLANFEPNKPTSHVNIPPQSL